MSQSAPESGLNSSAASKLYLNKTILYVTVQYITKQYLQYDGAFPVLYSSVCCSVQYRIPSRASASCWEAAHAAAHAIRLRTVESIRVERLEYRNVDASVQHKSILYSSKVYSHSTAEHSRAIFPRRWGAFAAPRWPPAARPSLRRVASIRMCALGSKLTLCRTHTFKLTGSSSLSLQYSTVQYSTRSSAQHMARALEHSQSGTQHCAADFYELWFSK